MTYQAVSITLYLVLAVVLEALRGSERRGYLHLWAVGLVLLAVETAHVALVGQVVLPSAPGLDAALLTAAVGAVGLGSLKFADLHPRVGVLAAGLGVLGGVALARVLEVPLLGSPPLLAGLLALVLTGSGLAVFLRSSPGPGRRLVLLSGIAMGAYVASVPWLRAKGAFETWEPAADIVLTVLTTVAVLVVHFERAQARERATAERYRSILEHAPAGVFRVEPRTGRVTAANPALRRLLDLEPDDPIAPFGHSFYVHPWQMERLNRLLSVRDRVRGFEAVLRGRRGREVVASIDAWILRDDAGRATAIEGMVRDLTEERRLQRKLVESQRLEALGRLSAGVAHDFNNLLTGALAASELTVAARHDPEAVRREMEELQQMVRRGGDLTRQLLAFGRQTPAEVGAVDLDRVLRPVLRVLDRVVGPSVRLEIDLGRPPPVLASVAQLEQIVTNLLLNARDAMPSGGRLKVSTRRLASGRRVRLVVEDDGVGMDEATRARIFEPFFTTKPEGKGSGLGLASVWGTVRQLKGEIRVHSRPGEGTRFEIDLPTADGRVSTGDAHGTRAAG